MKTAVAFKFAVYKDQATPSNRGKIVEVGDTVTLAVRNAGGVATGVDVVVTAVGNGGKDIQWDSSTTSNIRSEDIVRVGLEHQYQCPGPLNYQATITQAASGASLAGVTSVTLNGVVYAVNVAETGTPATGFTPEFLTALVDKLNSITGIEGFWSVTSTATTFTLKAGNMTYVWEAIALTNATVTTAIAVVA